MSSTADIKKAIKRLSGLENVEVYSKPGEVLSVNESKRTCVVRPSDGSANIYNVRLQAVVGSAKGIFPKPKVGSFVVVSFLSKNFAYVSLFDEIEEIKIDVNSFVFNGGQNKGLVKISDMVSRFNELISKVNNLEAYIATHNHSALNAPPLPPMAASPLSPATLSEFEDQKVKH